MGNLNQFKLELKTLLQKYNANISFSCSEYSDLHGVYDAQITVSFDNDDKEFTLSEGYGVASSDLKGE